jgi:hypothetical protein
MPNLTISTVPRTTLIEGGWHCVAGPFDLPKESDLLVNLYDNMGGVTAAVGPYLPYASHPVKNQREKAMEENRWGLYRAKNECKLDPKAHEDDSCD